MSQHIVNIADKVLISGTKIMLVGAGGHTRQVEVEVPKLIAKPDITLTIYSDESIPYNPYPEPKEGEEDVSNPGTTFAPWSIEYRPREAIDGDDRIIISATNTDPGVATPVQVVCSYLVIGELVIGETE
jgi:hypothetical protein